MEYCTAEVWASNLEANAALVEIEVVSISEWLN